MLTIIVPAGEQWDSEREVFINSKEQVLQLEHSLISLSKWESICKKPFMTKEDKTFEESVEYIKCMTITQNVNPDVYNFITSQNIDDVARYIADSMTATTFSNQAETINREVITAEIIYYWMVALQIPFECQKWHLNRLLTLINVCNIKNQPKKKIPTRDLLNNNRSLNAARRSRLNSNG